MKWGLAEKSNELIWGSYRLRKEETGEKGGNGFDKRMYSIKEMVSEIGATEWYWRSQIWDGRLPYVKVGRKMFIDRQDIESFIQRNKFSN